MYLLLFLFLLFGANIRMIFKTKKFFSNLFILYDRFYSHYLNFCLN